MPRFELGNTFSTGRKKGSRNRLTNDVRAAFHKAYDEMGENKVGKDGRPMTGHEAFLAWARDNQTEFYRLYAKLISQAAELPVNLHEDFVETLIFEEEQNKMLEGKAKVVDVTDV